MSKRNFLANQYWKKLGLKLGIKSGDLYEAFCAGWAASQKERRRKVGKKEKQNGKV